MNGKQLLLGLDVGTTKVCAIIGEVDSDANVEILGVGSHPSHGLKKGTVINIDKTIRSITGALEEAKLMAGVEVDRAAIGIAGNHIYSFNSTGVVAIKSPEITEDDVDRALEAAKAVIIPSDREILHVIPQEFRVDNTKGIKNPIGMCGVRLEVHVHIVTGMTALIQNLVKCVEHSGVMVESLMLQPIASSRSVLSIEEKDLGVVLVDIGGGTTDIAIWKDNGLVHSQIIPVGGNHFTNDLAVALKIPHTEAERIKMNHGGVLTTSFDQASKIKVQGIPGTKEREVSAGVIAEVLRARADELFGLIKKIIDEKELAGDITGGFVLTGGGALVKGLAEFSEFILERPVKIGYPLPFGGMTTVMQNPQFSTVLGLLLESLGDVDHIEYSEDEPRDIVGKLGSSLKSVFKEIF